MIRYSCDLCKRDLDPEDDLRYVVKIEVYAAFDPTATSEDENDRDHLQEIQDILECLEDADDNQIGDDVYQQLRFDLCPECRKKFLKIRLDAKPQKPSASAPTRTALFSTYTATRFRQCNVHCAYSDFLGPIQARKYDLIIPRNGTA